MDQAKHVPTSIFTAEEALKVMNALRNDKDYQIVFQMQVVKLPEYLTSQQAMDLIGCKQTYLFELVRKGIVKRARTTVGRLRYDRKEIQHLIDEGLI